MLRLVTGGSGSGKSRYLDAYSSEVSRYFRMANRPVMPRTLSVTSRL